MLTISSFSIPLSCTQPREFEGLPVEDRRLRYSIVPTSGRQKVTRNRFALEPDICLTDYRCEAVFDWIDLLIELEDPARACDLGKIVKSRKSWHDCGVRFLDRERQDKHEGVEFVVRVQEPTLARITEILRLVNDYRCVVSADFEGTEIVGFELAVDFYPKLRIPSGDLELGLRRARMSQLLRSHFILDWAWVMNGLGSDELASPRFSDAPRSKLDLIRPFPSKIPPAGMSRMVHAAGSPSRHVRAPINGTVYIGSMRSPLSYRLQDKVGDRRHDAELFVELGPDQRRSRIEVVLQRLDWTETGGPRAVSLGSIDEMLAARLSILQQSLFNFQIPTVGADTSGHPSTEEIDIFSKSGAYGLDLYLRSRGELAGRPSLGKKGHSLRYTDLNKMVSRALGKAVERFVRDADVCPGLAA